MRVYPCHLRSRSTGNTYRFDAPGYRCTVLSLGPKGTLTIGKNTMVGYHSNDLYWWIEVPQFTDYDPTQMGDKEDDI